MKKRETDETLAEPTCPICEMPKSQWSAHEGQGYRTLDGTYCCRGCAKGLACVCAPEGVETESDFPYESIFGGTLRRHKSRSYQ